ncbi:hypothetical protein AWB67_06443 [Caballeronia terrestris]|uniref:Uncharacterized protein n=1 Tax=Caballeronia terrestris TaxID=1226301 RepID=A0A158KT09_9BURK|nr:hypothetical protein [Caballeronia terrestris]SAL83571.1 hypothetical protein AWB67_06443 [Caballeronia terrestris]
MSQARGRYSGSRASGQRQPSAIKKSLPDRHRQPYVNGLPTRDTTQTASIFKTRSFQFLVDAVGAENIALGLDSNLARVNELMKGERFTPETAFHMETTLGLPHGFFDQPNPVLAAETIARLRSPLDFVQTDAEPEAVGETFEPDCAPRVSDQPFLEDRVPKKSEMQKKAPGGSSKLVQNSSDATGEPIARTAVKEAPMKVKTSVKASPQPSLALDNAAIQNIRRANLHVLTTRNGSKAKLGSVMGLTGSNMAHRLHGKKRMDDAEANRFTERLGLPNGWLDTPRSEADIPEPVSGLLLPSPRGRALQQERVLGVAAEEPAAAPVDIDTVSAVRAAASTFDDSSPHFPAESATGDASFVNLQDQQSDLATEPASPSLRETDALFGLAQEHVSVAAVPQLHPMPRPFTSVTSLSSLEGIEPIAEALIKTLAGKARTGRLDELKALQLLQQAVLL